LKPIYFYYSSTPTSIIVTFKEEKPNHQKDFCPVTVTITSLFFRTPSPLQPSCVLRVQRSFSVPKLNLKTLKNGPKLKDAGPSGGRKGDVARKNRDGDGTKTLSSLFVYILVQKWILRLKIVKI
jgi:hypothetical protein